MLYHVTSKNWGEKITLKPRISKRFEYLGEPLTPRICVAPSPELAWFAAGGDSYPTRVYATNSCCVEPIGVEDSFATKEKWILQEAEFQLVGEIDPIFFKDSTRNLSRTIKILRKQIKIFNQ